MEVFYSDHGSLDIKKVSVQVLKGGSTGLIQHQHPTPICLSLGEEESSSFAVTMTVEEASDLIEQLNEAVNCSVSHHTL